LVYPVFKQQLVNDFESFLSSFGGALGLWLGASFATVLHIPVFFFGSDCETSVEIFAGEEARSSTRI